MKCIVTGSNGFIGYHTCRRLMDLGEVIGVDDLSTGSADNRVDGAQYHIHSITDTDWLVHLLRDTNPEAVIHLAAVPRVAFSVQYPLRSAGGERDGDRLCAQRDSQGGTRGENQACVRQQRLGLWRRQAPAHAGNTPL